jgi:hypothetical protein
MQGIMAKMTQTDMEVDMAECAKNMTVTVTMKKRRIWIARIYVSQFIIWIASLISPLKVEVVNDG